MGRRRRKTNLWSLLLLNCLRVKRGDFPFSSFFLLLEGTVFIKMSILFMLSCKLFHTLLKRQYNPFDTLLFLQTSTSNVSRIVFKKNVSRIVTLLLWIWFFFFIKSNSSTNLRMHTYVHNPNRTLLFLSLKLYVVF